jgi:DtxR family transcriptional regulator, Mn-dependent transcriptional regulator
VSPHAIEDYLRTIQASDDEGVEVIQARIAERMARKPSPVSQMVDRLATYGYVSRSGRRIHLTDWGLEVAAGIIREHHLANRLLVNVLDIPDEVARIEATR